MVYQDHINNICSVLSHFLHPQAATSPLQDMALGTHFKPVLGDEKVQGSSVRRVVFCSGKYFYQLDKQRQKTSNTDTAIVRLEVSSTIYSMIELIGCEAQQILKGVYKAALFYVGQNVALHPLSCSMC